MRRSKQNCLKNCRKLRNDYYVIIVGEAFVGKALSDVALEILIER